MSEQTADERRCVACGESIPRDIYIEHRMFECAPKPGWLQRQVKQAAEDVKQLPDWLRPTSSATEKAEGR